MANSNVTKCKRNGFGKEIKNGAIKYRSIEALNQAFAKKFKLNPDETYMVVVMRLNHNWPVNRILSTPVRNKSNTLVEIANENGMSYNVLYNRLNVLGMSMFEALATPVRFRSPNGTRKAA